MTAPMPKNWRQMVDAWNDAEEFARQCDIYYASLPRDLVDITEPRYSREDYAALSGD